MQCRARAPRARHYRGDMDLQRREVLIGGLAGLAGLGGMRSAVASTL